MQNEAENKTKMFYEAELSVKKAMGSLKWSFCPRYWA
jgi:hypothetical protein